MSLYSAQDAARILRRLTYIKLDLDPFLKITKKTLDAYNTRDQYLQKYGDAVYIPAPETIVTDLSFSPLFLKFREELRTQGVVITDAQQNRQAAVEFVMKLLEALEVSAEAGDKGSIYIPRAEVGKLRTHSDTFVKDLYSHITRSGMPGSGRSGRSETWS